MFKSKILEHKIEDNFTIPVLLRYENNESVQDVIKQIFL